MGSETVSIRQRRDRDRFLVFFAVVAIIASLFAYTAARPAGVLAEHSEGFGPIDYFTVDVSGPVTAGTPFDVTVTAFDHADVVIDDYAGPAAFDATLAPSSTGCSGPCDPAYGTLTFAAGVATTSVTAYAAGTGLTLTVSDGGATGTSDPFDVLPAEIATLEISPDGATITADEGTETFTATGADAYGNDLGDVTGSTIFAIDGDGSCTGADCGSTTAGSYTVTGTNGSATDDVALTVTAGALATIEISPDGASITADEGTETYTATGADAYGNDLGDVTSTTSFDIDGDGSCTGADCGSTTAGSYTVTGTNGSATDDVALTVTAGALASIEISPEDASITADAGTQTYSAEGFDAYGNSRGDVTEDTDFDIDGIPCSGADCGSTTVGTYTVTGSNGSFVDSTSLEVTPGALNHFTFSAIGSQVAGTAFGFEITAWDAHGNVKTDYAGGAVLSGLADSPGCDDCNPSITSASASYGSIAWANGVATVSGVIARNAQTGAQVTATDGGVSDDTGAFAVTHSATLGGITIDEVGAQVAGTAFSVTVRAFDEFGNIKANQDGGSLSGLANSPGCSGCAPAVAIATPLYGTFSWTDGVATVSGVTARNAQSAASLTATVGTATNTSTFDVSHSATLGGITIDAIGAQVAGTSFSVTIRAFDEFGNVKLDQTGGSLSGLANSPGCGGCNPSIGAAGPSYGTFGTWSNGVVTVTGVTARNAQASATLTALVGGKSNDTSFAVTHSATLGGITIDSISTKVAGTAFSVTVRAFDEFGNVKEDQSGGALSGLADSPGCSGCNPAVPVAVPSYGTFSWSDGVATVSGVVARNAQTGATLGATVGTATNTSNDFTVTHSPNLGGITIDSISTPQEAGTAFNVTVRAFDEFGNVKANQTGGSLSGLVSSPGCAAPDCSPPIGGATITPVYGTFGWASGVATVTGVVAKNAQDGASLTATVGTATNTSNTFTVNPATAARLLFRNATLGFDGQPIDTKTGQPINHTCLPLQSGDDPANPCGTGSVPTKVMAIDVYGNRVAGVNITMTSVAAGVTGGAAVATQGGTIGSSPYGEASFPDLRITNIGSYVLRATAGALTRDSVSFRIVNELIACVGQTCENNVGNGDPNLQRAYGKIRTGSAFYDPGTTNVLLTTQFLPGSETNRCQGNQTIGQSTDLRVQGLGVGATAPSTQMVLILPKDTMMSLGVTSRGTGNFNVCLGVITIDGSTPAPWKGKDPTSKKFVFKNATPVTAGGETRYWGVPADCGTTNVVKGRVETLSPTDPCIGLRSKLASEVQAYLGMTNEEFAALGVQDADLVMVIEKRAPWDGKGGIY